MIMKMTEEQRKAMYAIMRAANAYLDNIGESMKLNRERFAIEQRMAEITERATAPRTVNPDAVWEQRRYDIAKTCVGMLAIGTIPDKFNEADLSYPVACRTAIALADELIRQLRGSSSEIPNNQADTRGYDKEGGER